MSTEIIFIGVGAQIITVLGVGVALGLFMWRVFGRFDQRIERLENRIGLVEQRVARIEGIYEVTRVGEDGAS